MRRIELASSLIQKWEGFKEKAYLCPAGVWTIGWGRTGKDVVPGTTTTRAGEVRWLDTRLRQDLSQLEKVVKLPVAWVSNPQVDEDKIWAALLSLVYNIGITNFKNSTLRTVLPSGNLDKIEAAWVVWNKGRVNGKLTVLKGLENRRADEVAYFRSALKNATLNLS